MTKALLPLAAVPALGACETAPSAGAGLLPDVVVGAGRLASLPRLPLTDTKPLPRHDGTPLGRL